MKLNVNIDINATADKVWQIIIDIENAKNYIDGIEKIEILNKPNDSLIGLKWRETRIMYGKEATEIMWITDAKENEFYETRAESHGAIYISGFQIQSFDASCKLIMNFEGKPQSFMAKIMNYIFSGMMKKSTEKAMMEDLVNIKNYAEKKNS